MSTSLVKVRLTGSMIGSAISSVVISAAAHISDCLVDIVLLILLFMVCWCVVTLHSLHHTPHRIHSLHLPSLLYGRLLIILINEMVIFYRLSLIYHQTLTAKESRTGCSRISLSSSGTSALCSTCGNPIELINSWQKDGEGFRWRGLSVRWGGSSTTRSTWSWYVPFFIHLVTLHTKLFLLDSLSNKVC